MAPRKRSRRVWTATVLLALGVVAVRPGRCQAELVVLTGGGVLKVDAFHREGDSVRLLLPGGGTLTLSLLRIERIVADEVADEQPADDALDSASQVIPFDEGHRVPETPFGELIYATARRFGLNPNLVAAIVRAESAFDPWAISEKGAAGLLQLMPATAGRFGLSREEIFDPGRNLEAGVRYLRWLTDRFDGDLPLVLAGYNAGEATVDRYRGVPPFRETREYIRRVYRGVGLVDSDAGSR